MSRWGSQIAAPGQARRLRGGSRPLGPREGGTVAGLGSKLQAAAPPAYVHSAGRSGHISLLFQRPLLALTRSYATVAIPFDPEGD